MPVGTYRVQSPGFPKIVYSSLGVQLTEVDNIYCVTKGMHRSRSAAVLAAGLGISAATVTAAPISSSVALLSLSTVPIASSVTLISSSVAPISSPTPPIASSVTLLSSSAVPISSSVALMSSSIAPISSSAVTIASSVALLLCLQDQSPRQ